jgi:hypothetical protein
MEPLLIVGIIALIAVIGVFAYKAEQKRRAAFRAWAGANGWSYSHQRNRNIYHQFRFLDRLNKGSNRYAYHVVRGEWEGRSAIGFTFHYETYSTDSKGNRTTHHHHFGVVAIEIDKSFPEMRLQPEGWLSRIGHAMGMQDIDFESVEFSKAFEVKSDDKKFAFDFCHTGMMEYLLQNPRTSLEVDGAYLALYDQHRLEPDEIEPYLNHLINIRQLMPEFLFRD